tara:strand:+ start:4186 stop:4857 length:672 start_codon:yes stop_codon:yes gene_type:complete
MTKVQIPASIIKDAVDRNAHKLLEGLEVPNCDEVSRLCAFEMLKTDALRKKRLEQMSMMDRLALQKEYNEKVSGLLHPNQRPSVVGVLGDADPRKAYEFVRFDKIETKHPIEYIDPKCIDYDIKNTDKENNKIKTDMPVSFLAIEEGDIESGKEWYKNYDPKLPDGICELMARHNWGDLKYMTKKSARNDAKKLKKKGKDLGEEMGFTVRKADKNNPIVVNFD